MKRAIGFVLLLTAIGCASGGAPGARRFDSAAMTNYRLSPQWAQYLVGALSRVASDAELEEYLALTDDAAAEAFVVRFWASRDPRPERDGNALRELFESRSAEADKRFSESGYLGRRTDRGTIWILHGAPDETDFEPNPQGFGELIEVWKYDPATSRIDLNGRPPDWTYRFLKQGDLKTFYVQPVARAPRGRGF